MGLSDCTQTCVTNAAKKYGCKGSDNTCFCSKYDQVTSDTGFAMCMIGCSLDDLLCKQLPRKDKPTYKLPTSNLDALF